MQGSKLGFEESLERHVVQSSKCVACATCVVVCPFNCLEYYEGQPKLVKECENCGICPRVCPKFDWSLPEVEEFVFGRKRKQNEEFGVYRRLILAQTTNRRMLEKCQDGGAVTAMLTYALENGIIEGAAVAGITKDKPLLPKPMLATTADEILESAGTRYTYSPNILALQEGVREKRKSLGFVGTPCQIHAIRKIQMFPLKKYSNPLRITIGLMCTESFTYEGLFEHLRRSSGIPLKEIAKMNIKGKMLVQLKSGEVKSARLSDLKRFTRPSCSLCNDFSSELSDISAGGLGLSGWTFVVLRTSQGEEIFDGALDKGHLKTRPVEEEPFAKTLLTKLTKKKLQNPES